MSHAPAEPEGSATEPRAEPSAAAPGRKQLPIWQEMALLLGIALVLAVLIKAFLMQAFYIPSASMNDTLVQNDRILVQKVSYWGDRGPHRFLPQGERGAAGHTCWAHNRTFPFLHRG